MWPPPLGPCALWCEVDWCGGAGQGPTTGADRYEGVERKKRGREALVQGVERREEGRGGELLGLAAGGQWGLTDEWRGFGEGITYRA